ncbi:hypothetical protein [Nocardioides sp.]|uniref:hypothetical protein n=1 Tax=Nocardioides sp. TaxID=35761 RepID=UPI003D0BE7A3
MDETHERGPRYRAPTIGKRIAVAWSVALALVAAALLLLLVVWVTDGLLKGGDFAFLGETRTSDTILPLRLVR